MLGGLTHLALVIDPSWRSLSFSVLHRVVSSSRAIQIGVNGTMMLNVMSLTDRFPSVAVTNLWRVSFCLSQEAASLLGGSISIPLLASILRALIVASGLSGVLMSERAFWKVVSILSRDDFVHCSSEHFCRVLVVVWPTGAESRSVRH